VITGTPFRVERIDMAVHVWLAEMPRLIIPIEDSKDPEGVEDFWSALVEHAELLSEGLYQD
jgi:hypothetical protein